MVRNAEDKAREQIDKLLTAAGWLVCDADKVNLSGSLGVAIREFPLPGHGFADYLLYVAGKAAGVIEAKAEGATLSGVETQSAKYTRGLPKKFSAWNRPLPFLVSIYWHGLSDRHAKGGGIILSRSTYPVTCSHC